MKKTKQIRRRAAYLLARSLITLFNVLPRSVAVSLGSWIGLLAWWVIVKDQHKMERHLGLAFGQTLSERQRQIIGRDFYVNSGRNYADVLRLPNHFKDELIDSVSVEGLSNLEDAYMRGKGVIAIGGHIGNYELLAAYLVSFGFPVAVIGRELYDKRLDRLLLENREAAGIVNFRTTEKARTLIDWLRDGRLLGVLIDTDSHRVRSVPVRFFGRMSNTPVGQMILGLRAGAAFCPMACVRTGKNRYKVIIRPSVQIRPTGSPKADALALTAQCSKELENIIRHYPDQWIWLHNRWHSKFSPSA